MKNPNKYIRQAIVTALSPNYTVYYKRAPKSLPLGSTYVVIGSQGKTSRNENRCGHDWTCFLDINIYHTSVQGSPPSTALDDLEEFVIGKMKDLKVTGGFRTKHVHPPTQTDLEEYATDRTIDRRILSYEIWLNNEPII